MSAQDAPFMDRIHGNLNDFRKEWNNLMALRGTKNFELNYWNSIVNARTALVGISGIQASTNLPTNKTQVLAALDKTIDEIIAAYKEKFQELMLLSNVFNSPAKPSIEACLVIIQELNKLSQDLARNKTGEKDPWSALSFAMKPVNLGYNLYNTAKELKDDINSNNLLSFLGILKTLNSEGRLARVKAEAEASLTSSKYDFPLVRYTGRLDVSQRAATAYLDLKRQLLIDRKLESTLGDLMSLFPFEDEASIRKPIEAMVKSVESMKENLKVVRGLVMDKFEGVFLKDEIPWFSNLPRTLAQVIKKYKESGRKVMEVTILDKRGSIQSESIPDIAYKGHDATAAQLVESWYNDIVKVLKDA